MGWVRTIVKLGVGAAGLATLAGVGGFMWAKSTSDALRARHLEVPPYDFPIPFPLSAAEVEELRQGRLSDLATQMEAAGTPLDPTQPPPDVLADLDLDAIARERAILRGQHLVQARYVCIECHGKDFSGGVMVDDPMMGRLLGPNLTAGKGGLGGAYEAVDYDRLLRHGVRKDGRPALMPCEDFDEMSDRELSDIATYIRSVPPVDRKVPEATFGPLGHVLTAAGEFRFAYDVIRHDRVPLAEPPDGSDPVALGRHIAGVCTGCHHDDLKGGKVPGGPPDWAEARDITTAGLGGWTYEQFVATMRTGKRPDGAELKVPMTLVVPYMNNTTDEEMQALWAYLQTVPPTGATH